MEGLPYETLKKKTEPKLFIYLLDIYIYIYIYIYIIYICVCVCVRVCKNMLLKSVLWIRMVKNANQMVSKYFTIRKYEFSTSFQATETGQPLCDRRQDQKEILAVLFTGRTCAINHVYDIHIQY